MHAVSFCKCNCGTELKLLQELDDQTQAYTCSCGQEFEFLGTIVEIYTSHGRDVITKTRNWKSVQSSIDAS